MIIIQLFVKCLIAHHTDLDLNTDLNIIIIARWTDYQVSGWASYLFLMNVANSKPKLDLLIEIHVSVLTKLKLAVI